MVRWFVLFWRRLGLGRSVQLSLHQPSLQQREGAEQNVNSHRNATRPDTSHPALRLLGESRHLGALLTSWKILAAWPQNTHLPISREAHRGEKCEACIIPKETKGHCLMPERCCPVRSLGNPHPRWHQGRVSSDRRRWGQGAATWLGGRGGGMAEAGILLESGNDKCLPLGTLPATLQDHSSQPPVICIPTGWGRLLPTTPPSHPVPTPAKSRMERWSW